MQKAQSFDFDSVNGNDFKVFNPIRLNKPPSRAKAIKVRRNYLRMKYGAAFSHSKSTTTLLHPEEKTENRSKRKLFDSFFC